MKSENIIKQSMDKVYNPKDSEQKIYALWERSGYFTPKIDREKKPFTIIMPPPNANGALHIGHALFVTLQDIMIRYHRMKGESALWLPGADHAGFETQVVFDKKLEREGRRRNEIPNEQLIKEMMNFTLENKNIMENQLRKLGASCDWTRNKFTLDKDIVDIVYKTFEKLKEDGLIYKGSRLVNWCCKHQTSLSDLEIKYEEKVDKLYYLKYPIIKNSKSEILNPKQAQNSNKQNSKQEFIKVATVRPETMLGDAAVAVNPKDKRYKDIIGKTVLLPITQREIPIIADETVDMEFGTGAVKVTPAHDFADYEIWLRHKNEIPEPKVVIDKYGKMNDSAGPYKGMKVAGAREKVVTAMTVQGLLDEKDTDLNYKHNVAVCYKCGTVIEPTLMENQWFVKMTDKPKSGGFSLRDLAVETVKKGKIKFIPSRFEKIFLQWMENLRDWNISRQIPWGIPIPVESEKLKVKNCKDKLENNESEGETGQVFDTWFSSGQWPFATLLSQSCKSEKLKVKSLKLKEVLSDFEYFYPTTVMETAADILFFWVARMVMLGIYTTGKIPFKYVYLHGLVRDKDKQKMSKSKGNVINPLGVVDLYGADALRMALVFANSPGADIAFSEDKIVAQRRFCNKIWNAARFVFTQIGKSEIQNPKSETNSKFQIPKSKTEEDKKILKSLQEVASSITKDIDNFQFHEAAQKIYQFFWHTFCDVYIEASKKQIEQGTDEEKSNTQNILLYVLRESLKLLHPFMPFITEQIYQMLPNKEKDALVMESWPNL